MAAESKMELYEKRVSTGGKVSYVLHVPPPVVEESIYPTVRPAPVKANFTNGEMITWTATIVIIQLMTLEKLLPTHAKLARTEGITKVRKALIELLAGTGGEIDDDLANYVADTWNLAMFLMQHGLVEAYKASMKLEEGKPESCGKVNCKDHTHCNDCEFQFGDHPECKDCIEVCHYTPKQ